MKVERCVILIQRFSSALCDGAWWQGKIDAEG